MCTDHTQKLLSLAPRHIKIQIPVLMSFITCYEDAFNDFFSKHSYAFIVITYFSLVTCVPCWSKYLAKTAMN